MSTAGELLARYEEAGSWEEAEAALDALASGPGGAEVGVGDFYDELAEAAAEHGDPGRAARLQRKALVHGCEHPELAREMLAWYLVEDGQRVAGEAEFAALLAERGEDVQLLLALGAARSSAGHHEDALAALDRAVAAARDHGAPKELARALAERREARAELGLPPDEDDRLAPRPVVEPEAPPTVWALGWFPREERAAALARWPDLADALGDADAYCRRMEAELRATRAATGRRPAIAPLRVAALLAFAEREGLDAGEPSARAHYAAELARRGELVAWPPSRNEPCWCGSGRKYKRCCASA